MVIDRQLNDILRDRLPADTLRLTRGELLLLDWVLCTGSSLMSQITDDLVTSWHDFRLNLWEVMPRPDETGTRPSLGVLFSVSETDAKVLLVAVPTTFPGTDGADCGESLKIKLAERLLGSYVDPQMQRDLEDEKEKEDASKDEAKDKAPSPPQTGC